MTGSSCILIGVSGPARSIADTRYVATSTPESATRTAGSFVLFDVIGEADEASCMRGNPFLTGLKRRGAPPRRDTSRLSVYRSKYAFAIAVSTSVVDAVRAKIPNRALVIDAFFAMCDTARGADAAVNPRIPAVASATAAGIARDSASAEGLSPFAAISYTLSLVFASAGLAALAAEGASIASAAIAAAAVIVTLLRMIILNLSYSCLVLSMRTVRTVGLGRAS